ncbi:MAG: SPOR domain-containing protein, partial [Magnetococcales bacterium]|nr:SPOR domain-containing protein [Magnetococcales bacterium]
TRSEAERDPLPKPVLVAPPPPRPSPPSIALEKAMATPEKVTHGPRRGFALQIEYGEKQEGAALRAQELIDKGYAAYVVRTVKSSQVRFAVRIGHFATETEAMAAAERFREREGRSAYAIKWRPAMTSSP